MSTCALMPHEVDHGFAAPESLAQVASLALQQVPERQRWQRQNPPRQETIAQDGRPLYVGVPG